MQGGNDMAQMPPMPPAQPPMGDNAEAPETDEEIPQQGDENGADGSELQSDAASLGQKLRGAESSEIKSVINQILGTCAGNLSSKDSDDIKKKLDEKGNGDAEESENDDMTSEDGMEEQPHMPMESIKHSNNFLHEIIDSIINKDNREVKNPKIKNKNKKENPFSGRK